MSILVDLFEQYTPHNSFDLGFYTLLITCVASRFIYYLSQVFSPLISKSYINLTDSHKADWDTRYIWLQHLQQTFTHFKNMTHMP